MPTQDEINRAEWNNPDNWSGPGILKLYFSKKDTRVWVPKWIWWCGWTVNLGRDAGVAWLLGIFFGIFLAIIAAAGFSS